MSDPGASPLILTPNLPLAQQLRRAQLQQQGLASAPSAPVYQLQQWLQQQVQPKKPLATEAQLQLLWEQVIADYQARHTELSQLNPGFLAGRALTAWHSLKRWQIPLEELARAETGQLINLSHWIRNFEQRLDDLGLTTLDLELEKALNQPVQLQPKARLYAFIIPPPPLWQRFLQQHFEQIEPLEFTGQHARAQLTARDKPEQELEAAIQWAAEQLADNPNGRIGIIDFNLGDHLKAAERLAGFYLPQTARLCPGRAPALSDTGPVQAALALLQLNGQQLDLATARRIAQSRHWGRFGQEYDARARWDRALCAYKLNRLDCVQLFDALDDQPLRDLLARPFNDKRQVKRLSPLQWAARFQQQLDALGLFGANPYYNWEHWQQALDQFSALGDITGPIDAADALRLLNRQCARPRAQSHPDGPGLYLLDTVEAAADFDQLWVLGMNSQNWPGAPAPNPLLPVPLQIRYQLPHASAEQEAELARQLVARLQQAAGQVIFSYARLQDDLEQSASALVADLPRLPPPATTETAFQPALMQWIDCSRAPQVPDTQKQIRGYGGGAPLLRTMATSPFNAFALWRLYAEPLEQPQIGLSPADRGTLVHRVLDNVWKQLKDWEYLQSCTEQELNELCHHNAWEALKPFLRRFGHQFVSLETQRIADLIHGWLQLERQRPPFSVELAEQRLQTQIGPLQFDMRLDRLDRTADGQLLLIDYKTGNSLSRNAWLDMPPAEPQLPLYALNLPQPPDALCFAKVRPDKLEFIGIGREALIAGIQERDDWDSLLDQWRAALETLAEDYVRGDARVLETQQAFGQTDPYAPLHRYAEKDQLDSLSAHFEGAE